MDSGKWYTIYQYMAYCFLQQMNEWLLPMHYIIAEWLEFCCQWSQVNDWKRLNVLASNWRHKHFSFFIFCLSFLSKHQDNNRFNVCEWVLFTDFIYSPMNCRLFAKLPPKRGTMTNKWFLFNYSDNILSNADVT